MKQEVPYPKQYTTTMIPTATSHEDDASASYMEWGLWLLCIKYKDIRHNWSSWLTIISGFDDYHFWHSCFFIFYKWKQILGMFVPNQLPILSTILFGLMDQIMVPCMIHKFRLYYRISIGTSCPRIPCRILFSCLVMWASPKIRYGLSSSSNIDESCKPTRIS